MYVFTLSPLLSKFHLKQVLENAAVAWVCGALAGTRTGHCVCLSKALYGLIPLVFETGLL